MIVLTELFTILEQYPRVLNVTVGDSICSEMSNDNKKFRFRCQYETRGKHAVNIALSLIGPIESITFLINDGKLCMKWPSD